jgi:hypothetical protein
MAKSDKDGNSIKLCDRTMPFGEGHPPHQLGPPVKRFQKYFRSSFIFLGLWVVIVGAIISGIR